MVNYHGNGTVIPWIPLPYHTAGLITTIHMLTITTDESGITMAIRGNPW